MPRETSGPLSASGSSVLIGPKSPSADPIVNEAEALYRSGKTRDALALCDARAADVSEPGSAVRLELVRGMALFDLGDAVSAIAQLTSAHEHSNAYGSDLQFAAAFTLFVRQADFQSPGDALVGLSRLRQLATIAGDPQSLAGLHFALARLEAYRGYSVGAHRHLEIARRFAERSGHAPLRCTLDIVEVSLEFVVGNLSRARQIAETCFVNARAASFRKYVVASEANLAAVALYSGDLKATRRFADEALRKSEGLPYLRIGVLDTLSQLALRQGEGGEARSRFDQFAGLVNSQRLPARSWYDLAHQLTRCAYFESLEDWDRVLEIAEDAEPELVRRQFRSLRTTLACARARALARLERHQQAEQALGAAVRACPRGAIDPLIVLEASRGVCSALAGQATRARVHFDRALAGCRAIGHRYHEWWISRARSAAIEDRRARVAVAEPVAAVTDVDRTSLVLADVSAILGAGHSIDLLAHRLVTILEHASLGPRLTVESESGRAYRAEPSATWNATPEGTWTLRLRGSDRRISIHVRDVHSLDDIALLKNVADVVQASIRRTADAEIEDGQQQLWPETAPPTGDDTIFRSPRMLEVLRVAMRLASADLPILISGETGTGKEVLAQMIHEHSQAKRGPFVAFNCATMPRDLVESQLFGHRRGAFTGALDSFPGVIRAAERGTLFLDEIGDLDPAVQPKLLRFLESGEVHPIGETRPQTVRVRVVAATNADLSGMVEQGRFRRDLFYRVGIAPIALPPLRERKDEIPALAGLFLDRYCRECQRRDLRLGDDFVAALLLYDWPGNIRQLANEIRRVVAMAADGETLSSSALAFDVARLWNARPTTVEPASATVSVRLDQSLEQATAEVERRFIEHAMAVSGGRVAEAAELLGLSRKGLFLKRRRQGLIGK